MSAVAVRGAGRRGRVLDVLARHCLALGIASFVGLAAVGYGFLMSLGALTACDDAGGVNCTAGSNQRFVAMVVALAVVAMVAVAATVASFPMNALSLFALGAWFVHWYGS